MAAPGAGALLTLGTSAAALQRLAPLPLPPLAPQADLGGELFGHLPPTLPASDPAAAAATPLLQVALVSLASGGAVLGLRVSHMVADFGTVRAVLHHLARAYSGRSPTDADVPAPAAPAIAALAAASLPLPAGFEPWNYRPLPPVVSTQFAALAAKPPLQALTLHVSAARLAALKEQAMAELAAAGSTADAAGDGQQGTCAGAWVSSNDALMAWLWKALAALPCRRGAVTPFNLALDMRSRMQLPTAHPTLPRWVYGNLATSAFCPELDAAALPLGQVALALRQTVVRWDGWGSRSVGCGAAACPGGRLSLAHALACGSFPRPCPPRSDAGKFAGDVAYATQHAASGGSCSALAILPVLRILEAASAGQVWR